MRITITTNLWANGTTSNKTFLRCKKFLTSWKISPANQNAASYPRGPISLVQKFTPWGDKLTYYVVGMMYKPGDHVVPE